jgi:hypothetical protein
MTQRYAYIKISLCLALLLAGPPRLQAQERQPYTLDQVVRLLESGVFSTNRILTLAREACIAFRVDAQAERQLIAANATEDLISGLRDVCIRLPQVVTYVVVAPAELTVPVNGSSILQAFALGPDSVDIADVTIRWSVEDTSIAAVSAAAGVVFGKRAGRTRVIARSDEGPEGSAVVIVGAAALAEEEPRDSLVGGKSVGTAAALGIIPGGGELYVGNTAKGLVILGGSAAAVAIGALISTSDSTITGLEWGGNSSCTNAQCEYEVDVTYDVKETNYIAVGAAVAGALWLYGLIDGIITAKNSGVPASQVELDQDPGLSLRIAPRDGIKLGSDGTAEITFIRIQS